MTIKIAIVPLDDRPCCYTFTKRLGELGPVEVIQPPRGILGQFTKPGNGEKLTHWLKAIVPNVDGLIVALDQLAYGGLVASRTTERSLKHCLSYIDVLRELKKRHPNLLIYVANVLMRISITSKNNEYMKHWRNIYLYSQLYDRVHRLDQKELKDELDRITTNIPKKVLDEYLAARKRNHAINCRMIDWVAEGIIDYLIITQEDASDVGIHLSEQRILMQRIFERDVQDRVLLYPGADEATQTLLARMTQYFCQKQLRVYPKYLSLAGQLVVPKFEDRPLEESVRAHISAAGALCVESVDEADLMLYINTPLEEQTVDGFKGFKRKAYFHSRQQYQDFITSMKHYMAKGYPVAVADLAFPNASDIELVQCLIKDRLFLNLYAYAGWNTSGNSLGTCISHAVMNILSHRMQSVSVRELQVHLEFLMERLLDEWAYQANVRTEVNQWLESALETGPSYLGDYYDQVNAKVKRKLKSYVKQIKEMFVSSTFEWNHSSYKIKDIREDKIELPWNRTFEVDVSIACELEKIK